MQTSIAGPLLLFLCHAIHMRDTRCCGVVLRVFRSIVPEFSIESKPKEQKDSSHPLLPDENFPISDATKAEIHQFLGTDVMRAAISSMNDPYFVDSQKDLATLIATILIHCCIGDELRQGGNPAPRQILCSLPGIKEGEVDRTLLYLSRSGTHSRQQRAVVLDLLRNVKSVSISEMGKLKDPREEVVRKAPKRSKMAQKFMTPQQGADISATGTEQGSGKRQATPDLTGVAGMFDEGH